MLCKRPPWSDIPTKPKRVMELIGSTDQYPNYLSGISQECYDFIFNACLQRDVMGRWTAKQLLEHPFLVDEQLHASISPLEMKDLLVKNYRKSCLPDTVVHEVSNPFEVTEEKAQEPAPVMTRRRPKRS